MRIRRTAAAAVVLLTVTAGTAAALAIYDNDFSSRAEAGDLHKLDGGKACHRSWARKEKVLEIRIRKGAESCVYATPVRGDAGQPDHLLELEVTVAKTVPKALRDKVFVAISVRSDEESGYVLRIVPGTGSWELRREPGLEGFPMQGTDPAVAGLGKPNELSLDAAGDRITASVNGKRLVDAFTDPNPSDVTGRRTTIAFGTEAEAKETVAATLDDLRVSIPGQS